ncbi:uncharacterized protein LOC135432751 isoform X2 [Drosophila montana]|uniref:uncharacterized protein LOC135432751 isoform X2 n=1 Tax=Drosophila montana TaxID=40370 RepID=UPI00313B97D5
MRISFVALAACACLALAAADVSHLSSSYLPPPKPEQVEHMTIEQHELRELPEQVDYMRENEQGAMEISPSSQLTPPAMPQQEQMPSMRYLPPAQPTMPTVPTMPAMPATRYLPPAQPIQRAQAQPESEPMMQPEMMPQPAMEYTAPAQPQPQAQPQAAPAMRYLPPAQQADQPQYIYEQYQEQDQQMPYILDVQQPMAPSDAETLAYEPEPAHELRQDGYHYKQAAQEQRLRH